MYDASQPRVPAGDRYGGRWTSGGAGGGPAGVRVAGHGSMPAVPRGGLTPLNPAMVHYLGQLLQTLTAPIRVYGGLLVGILGEIGAAYGTLPDHPDIQYRYKDGWLTITQDVPGDRKPLLFHGRAGDDGAYRLPDGTVIGHDLGDGVLLSEDAAWSEKARRTAARAQSKANTDEPQVCPAATNAPPNNDEKNPKAEWPLYQEQVTGLSSKFEVIFNGVSFDGCRNEPGRIVLLEAKGERYASFIQTDGSDWKPWFTKTEELVNQMRNQSKAAGTYTIEWHVAEKHAADFFRKLAADHGYSNIIVIHEPPRYK